MNLKGPLDSVLTLAVMVTGVLMLTQAAASETAAAKAASDLGTRAEMARLLEIAKQGRSAARPIDGAINVAGHPAVGNANAPLVMIELGSYQCGFCRKHYLDTMPALRSNYIDTGKLRYVFFDFALDPRHKHAAKAAEAAHCANEQGRYWEFRGQLFRNSKSLAEVFLESHAEAVGLDVIAFRACLDSGRHAARLAEDRGLSRKLKVRGTPSFFIGRPNGNGEQVMLVKRISGARTVNFFAQQLDALYAQLPNQGELVSGMGGQK
jgi:protein-disulfide isomerase